MESLHDSQQEDKTAGSTPFDTCVFKTEVELAKAKRLYHALEKRLDQERHTFEGKAAELQGRIFDLETKLHQAKVDRLTDEEEARARQAALAADNKRARARHEVLEKELHDTKKAWAQRLADERKGWQHQVTEKVVLLQGQIDEARAHYTAQIHGLQEDLREAMTGRNLTEKEVDTTKTLLREETAQRRVLETEVDEFRGKYRRCMELASELIAVRGGSGSGSGKGSGSRSASPSKHPSSSATARPAIGTATHTPLGTTSQAPSFRLSSENEVLKKQLKLTQVLLDEELRKNHTLRQSMARLSV